MAWKIFLHSVRLVLRNWQQALKLSSPVVALTLLNLVLFGSSGAVQVDLIGEIVMPSPLQVALNFATLIAALAVAVSWHRFVLLEEETNTPFPAFHGPQVMAYFGKILLLVLAVIAIAFCISIVIGLLSILGQVFLVLYLPMGMALAWGVYRLSPILPAAAVGNSMTFREAWDATEPHSTALFALIFVTFLIGLLVALAFTLLAFVPLLLLAAAFVVNWFFMMLNISMLTTIYGVSVEGRQI